MFDVGSTRTAFGAAAMVAVLAGVVVRAGRGSATTATPADGGSDAIVSYGVCDAGSTWALTGRSRFLRVVVGARVDSDARRQRWVLRIKRDATTVAKVSRKSNRKGVVKVKGRSATTRDRTRSRSSPAIAPLPKDVRGTLTF